MDNETIDNMPDVNSDDNVSANENSIAYPSASIMLEISKDEYAKERERSNNLDNKANIFISAIIAMVTLYIPIIPFSAIKKTYIRVGKLEVALITISICILGIAFVSLINAFYNLYKAISVKPFHRVNFDNLNDETVLRQYENDVERGLLEHYHTILTENAKINDNKAERLTQGLKFSILSFALMSISTISLIIIIG